MGGTAEAPQCGFLGGQGQDLHGGCEPSGLHQAEQHEVLAAVVSWDEDVLLQEAQLEVRVWEAVTDLEELDCVFILKRVTAPQPDSLLQWAAVSTHWGCTRTPPHWKSV